MSELWIATIIASAACFLLKFLGFSMPDSILNQPRIQQINLYIPIVLLSALVAVQTVGDGRGIVFDHRLAGVAVASIALRFKVPFPLMMLTAAVVSALIYRAL